MQHPQRSVAQEAFPVVAPGARSDAAMPCACPQEEETSQPRCSARFRRERRKMQMLEDEPQRARRETDPLAKRRRRKMLLIPTRAQPLGCSWVPQWYYCTEGAHQEQLHTFSQRFTISQLRPPKLPPQRLKDKRGQQGKDKRRKCRVTAVL